MLFVSLMCLVFFFCLCFRFFQKGYPVHSCLSTNIFFSGDPTNEAVYITDRTPEDTGKVSGGDLKKLLKYEGESFVKFFHELCGNKDKYVLTAGSTFDERKKNCTLLNEKLKINTIRPISQEKEMDLTIKSVSNLPRNTGAVIATGSTTIHGCLVDVDDDGKATMIDGTYMFFPTNKNHKETADTLSEIIKMCSANNHVVGIAGAPTRAISFENVEQDPYYNYGVKELEEFIGNLGEKGKDQIDIFEMICANILSS